MPTRYVPLSSLGRMEQLVDGLLGPTRTAPRHDRQIPVDAVMGEGELALYFDLPGVSPDAIELAIERRVLTVRADRPYTPREGEQVFFAERPWGQFSRQIVLSDTLDTNRVNASFDNGVLLVTIPVAEQAQSRRIEVTHAPLRTDAHEVSATSKESATNPRE